MPGTAANLGRPAVRDRLCRFGGGPAGRDRATPHHKSYCRADSAGEALAWVAVGSHNLSGAAWGALQLNGQQLQILSYELSVLMLPDLEAAYRASPSFRFSCTRPADDDVAEADKAPADVAEADVAEAPADVAEVRFVPYRRGRHPGGGGRAEGRTDVAATPGEADARGRRVLRVAVPLPYRVVPLQYGAADAPWACDADYGDARDCHGRRRRGEEEVEMQEAVVAGLARGVAEWARGAAGGGGLG
jgi:tyrosyl-DNA phosphodiesterase-1